MPQTRGNWVTPPCGLEERTYRGITHRHSDACAWRLRESSTYLVRVHQFWQKTAELPTLEKVRYKYLYGNDFSEETPGASPIQVDATLPRALQ